MPSQERRERHQWAVIWPASTTKDDYGEYVLGSPVEIRVRWVERRHQVPSLSSEPVMADVQLHTDYDVTNGSVLWLGRLEDYYGTGSSGDESITCVAVGRNVVPDIKARATLRYSSLQFQTKKAVN